MKKFDNLTEMFRKRPNLYKSVNFKIAALKINGKWYNRRASAIFSPEKVTEKVTSIIKVENFSIFSFISDVSLFRERLFNIAKNGRFIHDHVTVLFINREDNFSPNYSYSDYHSRNQVKSIMFGIDWPADYFRWEWSYQNGNQGIQKIADTQVRCHSPPYESVRDAICSLLPVYKDACSRGSILWWIFPTYLSIDRCTLEGKKLEVKIRFHKKINLKDVRLSVIGTGSQVKREILLFNEIPVVTDKSPIIRSHVKANFEKVSIDLCAH